jgi:hypothetical protein
MLYCCKISLLPYSVCICHSIDGCSLKPRWPIPAYFMFPFLLFVQAFFAKKKIINPCPFRHTSDHKIFLAFLAIVMNVLMFTYWFRIVRLWFRWSGCLWPRFYTVVINPSAMLIQRHGIPPPNKKAPDYSDA